MRTNLQDPVRLSNRFRLEYGTNGLQYLCDAKTGEGYQSIDDIEDTGYCASDAARKIAAQNHSLSPYARERVRQFSCGVTYPLDARNELRLLRRKCGFKSALAASLALDISVHSLNNWESTAKGIDPPAYVIRLFRYHLALYPID